jgi:ABC-type glycerol-3-phosphate transport system substrate-binding protein
MNRILLALAVLLLSVGCSEGPESPTPSNSSAVEVIKITAEDLDERAEEYRNNLDEFLEKLERVSEQTNPSRQL